MHRQKARMEDEAQEQQLIGSEEGKGPTCSSWGGDTLSLALV